jgi:hypothetical protein
MSGAQIRLTRMELYQKVWSAPRATVAKEFGFPPGRCQMHAADTISPFLPTSPDWTAENKQEFLACLTHTCVVEPFEKG